MGKALICACCWPLGMWSLSSYLCLCYDPQFKAEQSRAMYVAASLTFELGIIFHSIFVGLTYGTTSDPATLHALSIAL